MTAKIAALRTVTYQLVQYANGERRAVCLPCPLEDEEFANGIQGCATEFLAANDTPSGGLLEYDLSCDLSGDEISNICDLNGCTVLLTETFQGR